MSPPDVISTLITSKNITQKLCQYRNPVIGVGLEGVRLGTESGEITLVYLIDSTNKVYVFDIYKNPGLVQDGGLADLLRCDRVTKVVENCQVFCAMFYWRYGIIVKNIFDVQLAYSLTKREISSNCLPREESLKSLKAICDFEGITFNPDWTVKHTADVSKFFWRTRPLSSAMLDYLGNYISVLPRLYENFNRFLCADILDMEGKETPSFSLSHTKGQARPYDEFIESINDRLKELARQNPQKLAFVFRTPGSPRSTLTRAEVWRKSTNIALHFVNVGIRPGDKVAVLIPSGKTWIIVQFGIYMAGAVAVNGLSDDRQELKEKAESIGCTAIIIQSNASNSEDLDAHSLELVFLQNDKVYDVAKLMLVDPPRNVKLPIVSADDAVVMMPTSGSTGIHKFVLHTLRSLLFAIPSLIGCQLFEANAITFNDRPMTWMGGYPCGYLGTGITTVYFISHLHQTEDNKFFVDVAAEERVTRAIIMEYRLNGILREPNLLSRFSRLHFAMIGGQRITANTIDRLFTLTDTAAVGYASTESLNLLEELFTDPDSFEDGTAGYPAVGVEAKIVNEKGDTVPFGTVGELLIKGGGCGQGYVKLDGSCMDLVDTEGWYHSEDVALMKPDGKVIITGRKTDMIKRATVKIFPSSIEKLLQENFDLQEVVVVGIPDERLYQEVCACVILKPGSDLTETEIQEKSVGIFKPHLSPDGIGYMPGHIFIMTDFPRTDSSKCIRSELSKIVEDMVRRKEM